VGKTLSARHYARWDRAEAYAHRQGENEALFREVSTATTVFYTSPVVSTPTTVERGIEESRKLLHDAAAWRVERRERAKMLRLLDQAENLRDPKKNPDGYRSNEAVQAEEAFYAQRERTTRVVKAVRDPTTLLIIDEADRLKMAGLEQVRNIFDHGGIGLVLIGMPGIEKRLARYPQFYSRIGFVHEFRPLTAAAIRKLFEHRWTPPGVHLPEQPWDRDAVAGIIRITGGNFRLLDRLLTQMERILEINVLQELTKAVVEAARESLVIGQS
jgi:DNA transposition AAA+ family ATPase